MLNASARMTISLAVHAGTASTPNFNRVDREVSWTTGCTTTVLLAPILARRKESSSRAASCDAPPRPRPDRAEHCALRSLHQLRQPPVGSSIGRPAGAGRQTDNDGLAWLEGAVPRTHCTFLAFLVARGS